jgi:hypothetical protein
MNEGTNNHLRVLGIVEVVYGAVHAVGALIVALMSFLGCGGCFAADSAREAMGVAFTTLAVSGGALVVAILFAAVALTGLALMNGRAWAKIGTIIFAVLSVANFPLGTAFAIYSLWAILAQQRDHRS